MTKHNAVFYTDGGCVPSRGKGGWGLHGYLYTDEPPKQGSGLKSHHLTQTGYVEKITPDAVNPVPKVVEVTPQKYYDGIGSFDHDVTNNIAELTAMLKVLMILEQEQPGQAVIYTDSTYVRDGITQWMEGWQKQGWVLNSGKPVANKEIWVAISESLARIETHTFVDIQWVKAHVGNFGNENVDRKASWGVIASSKGLGVEYLWESPAKGYWKTEHVENRLFSLPVWYFNTGHDQGVPQTEDGRSIYYLGNQGKDDDFFGRKDSEASFAILYLKAADPVLAKLQAEQTRIDKAKLNSLHTGRLDHIFQPEIYTSLSQFDTTFTQQLSRKVDLYSPDRIQLTRELRPPKLAFNLVDNFIILTNLLNEALGMGGGTANTLCETDITDTFYETETTKKKLVCKLRKKINSACKSLSVTVGYDNGKKVQTDKITLSLNLDLPDRNTLSAIADQQPTVKVITWMDSKQSFRYAVLIQTLNDVGIWCAFYANQHLLKQR